eukprot:218839-Chlamydomonas_euryale.AAC.9
MPRAQHTRKGGAGRPLALVAASSRVYGCCAIRRRRRGRLVRATRSAAAVQLALSRFKAP